MPPKPDDQEKKFGKILAISKLFNSLPQSRWRWNHQCCRPCPQVRSPRYATQESRWRHLKGYRWLERNQNPDRNDGPKQIMLHYSLANSCSTPHQGPQGRSKRQKEGKERQAQRKPQDGRYYWNRKETQSQVNGHWIRWYCERSSWNCCLSRLHYRRKEPKGVHSTHRLRRIWGPRMMWLVISLKTF